VPAIVFCGFGFPKQERVIARLYETKPQCWFISCGASIEMVAGIVSRAPTWIQRLGFEWLYRLVQEPVRLSERYLVRGLPFTARFLYNAVRCGVLQRVKRCHMRFEKGVDSEVSPESRQQDDSSYPRPHMSQN